MILEQRAEGSYFLESCLQIEQSKSFNFFIAACIIGNTVVLSLDEFPQNTRSDLNLEFINFIFYLVFICEMVIKLTANGLSLYFRNKYNRFDFLVIVISTADLVLSNIDSSVGLGAIRAMRIFRLLRVFKLAKVWKSFSYLISTISQTVRKLSYLMALVWLFWFTYAIVGKEIYAYNMSFSETDMPLSEDFDFETGK